LTWAWRFRFSVAQHGEHQGVGVVLHQESGAVDLVHVHQLVAIVEQRRLGDAVGHGQAVAAESPKTSGVRK
jgi:hypothetical protein